MWLGYFSLGGVELSRNGRTEVYARAAGYYGIKSRYSDVNLVPAVGGSTPTTAAANNAAWYDPNVPESADFHGVYTIGVDGLEDSTLTSTPTPSIEDGGRAGRSRFDGRTVVFNTVMVAKGAKAMEYGMAWLNRVLANPSTVDAEPGCEGQQLRWFTNGSGSANDLRRANRASVTVPPRITGRREGACGHVLWMVQFTLYVADPFVYAPDRLIVTDWVGSSSTGTYTAPGAVRTGVSDYTDPVCTPSVRTPLYDPLRPAMTPPPQYPTIPLDDYDPPTTWKRRTLFIPATYFSEWGELVPIISVLADTDGLRNGRFKFYRSADGTVADQCAWTDSLLITYIPSDHELLIDGTTGAVTAFGPGGAKRNADTVVLDADGDPMRMPILRKTGNNGYLVAFDLAAGEATPAVAVTLTSRNAIQAA